MEELKECVLLKILTNDEITKIPEDVKEKLETYFDERFDEFLTSKAIEATAKTNYDEGRTQFERQVSELTYQIEEYETKLEKSQQCVQNMREEITVLGLENAKLQELTKRHSSELCNVQSNKANIAVERDSLLRIVEKQTFEIERLQNDLRIIQGQLKVATDAKCDAMFRFEEIQSKESALEMRERRMEQERVIFTNQIQNLSDDLNRTNTELQTIRRDNTVRSLQLQTSLNEKSEELKIAYSQISHLKESIENLQSRAQDLNSKLLAQTEESNRIIDFYKKELSAKTKLTQLYKNSSDDKESETNELEIAISDLKRMLSEASEQYGELETKMKSMQLKHSQEIEEKDLIIQSKNTEIQNANDLLKEFQNESLEHALEKLAPSAVVANKLIKSNMSLTELYTLYVKSIEENDNLKKENGRVNLQIKTILHELEERAPIIKKQDIEYQKMMESNNELAQQLENILLEKSNYYQELNEATAKLAHLERENKKLKTSQHDLGRQVCYLLKEMEQIRSGLTSDNSQDGIDTGIDQVISRKLVTFSSIFELQENNQKLLLLVRDLSHKLEQIEEAHEQINEASYQFKIETLKKKLCQIQDSFENQTKILNNYITKYEHLKKMYFDVFTNGLNSSGVKKIDISDVENSELDNVPKEKNQLDDKRKDELQAEISTLKEQLQKQKREYDEYVKEKKCNDTMFNEQFDSMRSEVRDLTSTNCMLKSTIEYNNEQLKIQAKNIETYKNQIMALEERKRNYENSMIKNQEAIFYLKDEAMNAQKKQTAAEVQFENLKQQCRLLRETESRLQLEREAWHRERQTQNLLLNNLEMIKVSFERSETEGKVRLESRLDESNRELSALRRRLQEEQDKFRDLSSEFKQQSVRVKDRMQEEKLIADQLRNEINTLREELSIKTMQIEELSQKLQDSLTPNKKENPLALANKRTKELEVLHEEAKLEIDSINKELQKTREHSDQYRKLSESAENELKKLYDVHNDYILKTQKELEALKTSELSLKSRVVELETEMKLQITTAQMSNDNNPAELKKVQEEFKSTLQKLNDANREVRTLREEIRSLSASLHNAEQKYANEMMLHSADIQELTAVKDENSKLKEKHSNIDTEVISTKASFEESTKLWAEMEKSLRSERDELEKRLIELDEQNTVLHDQLQNLTTQRSLLTDAESSFSQNDSIITNTNVTLIEKGNNSSEKLLEIIKFLRKEKNISLAKVDILKSENVRLVSEHAILQKKLDELNAYANEERTKSETEIVTAFKHEEILRKVEMLNAVTDSNRILREERDNLSIRVNELTFQIAKIEDDIFPLQEKNRELTTKTDTLTAENTTLRTEAVKWRQRANILIDKNNKNPEEFKRMQNEREHLMKMLANEKELLKLANEELMAIKSQKAQLDSEMASLQRQSQLSAEEKKKLTDEITSLKTIQGQLTKELTELKANLTQKEKDLQKANEDLELKESQLADSKNKEIQIRKIAKRYKDSFFELKNKSVPTEEEGSAGDSADVQATDDKELKEKISELTMQIKKAKEDEEKLRLENEELKSTIDKDEKTKLLREARTRIITLTQSKDSVSQELAATKAQYDALKQSNEKQEDRIGSIESKYEEYVLKSQKDNELEIQNRETIARLTRENETLLIRVNQLNRQLGLQQVSKPSTSAVSIPEKSATESARTANVKPMSGTSGQQSATVTPWRGTDTPLASIRPISVQNSRTAAILPTSQTGLNVIQSSGSSITALVPPQQQVHTTGNNIESMSTSPTSSHTDYMPATSSAAIVVAAVLPMASSAESTQEAESITSQNETQIAVAPQQAVALVSPRVETAPSTPQLQSINAESQQELNIQPSTSGTSSSSHMSASSHHHASSSNSVTTTHVGSHKRPRDVEGEAAIIEDGIEKNSPSNKRTRTQLAEGTNSQPNVSESGIDVEYQVPTSSQRDQEYDIVIVDSEEDDGISDEGNAEIDEGTVDRETEEYEENFDQNQDMDEVIGQSNVQPDNNEVDNECVQIRDLTGNNTITESCDANESTSDQSRQQIQTISSGSGEQENMAQTSTWRQSAPLSKQQQATLMMLQKGCNDDSPCDSFVPNNSIVPISQIAESISRESLTSAHSAAQGNIYFKKFPDAGTSETSAVNVMPSSPPERKKVDSIQSSSAEESKADTLEPESVPNIIVNPVAADNITQEIFLNESSEENSDGHRPTQSVSQEDIKVDSIVEGIEDEQGIDSVTSEGEKAVLEEDDIEEGREAEASTSSVNTRSKGTRTQLSRRASRGNNRGGRPTPIVWQDPMSGRNSLIRNADASPSRNFPSPRGQRARRMRRPGGSNYPNMRY